MITKYTLLLLLPTRFPSSSCFLERQQPLLDTTRCLEPRGNPSLAIIVSFFLSSSLGGYGPILLSHFLFDGLVHSSLVNLYCRYSCLRTTYPSNIFSSCPGLLENFYCFLFPLLKFRLLKLLDLSCLLSPRTFFFLNYWDDNC